MGKKFFIVVNSIALVWGMTAYAGGKQISIEAYDNGEVDNDEYWTPERLQSAKASELPRAETGDIRIKQKALGEGIPHERIGAPGRSPTLKVKPDNGPLFEPLADESRNEITPAPMSEAAGPTRSQGASYAYFTSSRVVPAPAAQNYYPFRATGKLFFSDASGNNYTCSGTVINQRLVITAGHCVYDAKNNLWYKNFKFMPAYHNGSAPFGTWNWTWAITTSAWISGGGIVPNSGDFAVLEMSDNAYGQKIGNVTGWHGYFTYSANPNHLTMLGYPANFDSGGWMHRVDSQEFRNTTSNTVEYGSDMRNGSSGGPWLENFGEVSSGETLNPSGTNYVVAVTSYGPTDNLDYQGASILDTQFANSSKTGIYDKACAHKSGNC